MALLALWGVMSGMSLPVSLFPMSNQPMVVVSLNYGSLTPQQFFESIGRDFESKLQGIKVGDIGVENQTARYRDKSVRYNLRFGWGADPQEAMKTTETLATSFVSSQELGIRRSLSVRTWRQNSGFLAVSFYSPLRSLDELYDMLLPLTMPIEAQVPDADSVGLFNPSGKEINLKLSPEKMALHHLTTSQIEYAVRDSVTALSGGTVRIGERELQLNIPKAASSIENLGYIRVSAVSQSPVLLKDVAQISVMVSKESERKFKTSGSDSLILFANPKDGGNIKRMADDIMAELDRLKSQWPEDVEFQVLVNPSDFINESVQGVLREVGVAAFLAVLVLFLFIGSLKNVATAAIEIPLSLIMAFILMKLTGMNLNMISLGGLALSAGMNVDASVVVLENIFRHFEGKSKDLSYSERMTVILAAVKEVRKPIIASTIASLVVFMPLVFTHGLTNSLLGDLAKAVIFSHGLSAIVALILVPTIRLQLMASGEISHTSSPVEGLLFKLESFYRSSLTWFLRSGRTQFTTVLAVIIALPLLVVLILPKLKKEVVGRPETDWLIVGLNSSLISTAKQMESEVSALELDLFKNFGADIKYTFTQIEGSHDGYVMMRLKSRHRVEELSTKAEEIYKNTPTLSYWIEKWNPSELQIPNPPDFKVEIVGGTSNQRFLAGEDLRMKFSDQGVFDNKETEPGLRRGQSIVIEPLNQFTSSSEVLTRSDLSHYLRTASEGLFVEKISEGIKTLPIYLRFPEERTQSLEQIQALPIGFEGKLIPLGALAHFSLKPQTPEIYRLNQTSMISITGKMNKVNEGKAKESVALASKIVEEYSQKLQSDPKVAVGDRPSFNLPEVDKELREALDQLKTAVLISALLVFIVMMIQLGDLAQAGLVMVSIPLGIIGVVVSLYIFGSSLSLNSGLGTILLNGIAVANSIILVDFIQKLFTEGRSALEATVVASTTRLRPILMTSLTTVLGMLPIALGLGEGGKILQPLGVAVCGGLWVSSLMTLYIVPALQFQYLKYLETRTKAKAFQSAKLAFLNFEAANSESQVDTDL
jgi:hydrophobic/amphiphilic exporter-1 (mainly G- bacteria), HAE1 family